MPASGLWQTLRGLGEPVALDAIQALSPDDAALVEAGAAALFSDAHGRATCVGLALPNGFVGLTGILTAVPSRPRAVALTAGTALRFSRRTLRHEWETSAFFREAVLFEAHRATEAARRWGLCARRHDARRRLATLLIRLSDVQPDSPLLLSQQTASHVLNVRRPTATAASIDLEAAGALEWRRRGTTIVDRQRLLACACPCATA